MPACIGVDPGAATTGITAVYPRGRVHAAALIDWNPGTDVPTHAEEILDTVAEYAEALNGYEVVFALEDVVRPRGRLGIIDPGPLLVVAQVIGYLRARLPFVMIPPGGHGSGPLDGYPPELVGPTETTGTSGKRRHARSAYDVARVALTGRTFGDRLAVVEELIG